MKFAHWSREIAGWALLLIGLWICWNAYSLFLHKRVLDGTPVMFMGFIVFRGGIHVLKVAVAAQAASMLPETAPAQSVRRSLKLKHKARGPNAAKGSAAGTEKRTARPKWPRLGSR